MIFNEDINEINYATGNGVSKTKQKFSNNFQ